MPFTFLLTRATRCATVLPVRDGRGLPWEDPRAAAVSGHTGKRPQRTKGEPMKVKTHVKAGGNTRPVQQVVVDDLTIDCR